MSTTITIYFLESPVRLVLLVRKSSRSDQFVNSQKKENGKTALNLQPRKKSCKTASNSQPKNKDLRKQNKTSALTIRPPMQPMEREKFVEYKASASDSQVGPINLKLQQY